MTSQCMPWVIQAIGMLYEQSPADIASALTWGLNAGF